MTTMQNTEPETIRTLKDPLRRAGIYTAAGAIIAGLATLLQPKEAKADPLGSPCCALATSRWCPYPVDRPRWYCPSGYNRTYWTCKDGSNRTVYCGECTTSSSCWSGSYYCSIWYY
ncbi:hypothetical protein ABZ912_09160 [Nonomuraea angiospora]|uniref:hypothetical protein n=1 Tax=Nonomuraea angiospora TaxID=46172 RepID=UPI0033EA57DE